MSCHCRRRSYPAEPYSCFQVWVLSEMAFFYFLQKIRYQSILLELYWYCCNSGILSPNTYKSFYEKLAMQKTQPKMKNTQKMKTTHKMKTNLKIEDRLNYEFEPKIMKTTWKMGPTYENDIQNDFFFIPTPKKVRHLFDKKNWLFILLCDIFFANIWLTEFFLKSNFSFAPKLFWYEGLLTHIFFFNFFSPKIVLNQYLLDPISLGPKLFWEGSFYGPQIWSNIQILWSKHICTGSKPVPKSFSH